ncbi:MAG: hypothetical protein OEY79_03745, partial [Anaplasmataceae bacterium]|nr:hypothetical protein [Anaplasmataceae bacterium]
MLYLLVILLPLISSFLVACSGQCYRGTAIFLSTAVFFYIGYVFLSIDYNIIDYGLLPINFFKITSLSGVFILLTAFLVPLALLFGWNYRNKLFFILF